MHRSQRVAVILERLAGGATLDVAGVADDLGVSVATVRRDLTLLDEQNLLVRTRGGAVGCAKSACEVPVRYREARGRTAKRAIARTALRCLAAGPQVLAVNGGTTTWELARLLATRSEITVVTNALNIAQVLVDRPRVKLVVTGGVARSTSSELVGPWAERAFSGVTVDTVFIGVDGIDETGLSTHDEAEAHINAVMIERARRVVVLADGSKIGLRHRAHVADLAAVDELVTDPSADRAVLADLAARGVNVRVAEAAAETARR
ncbi:DeoR/GlpR transcriptional regulator [Actinospica durhamensis]|uniref:DeoR/GlpR transcriptional regulator n=2 Tax=Actinospica durhamensis TaxID=1508375 RepID=A0A941ILH9_9ACTN|nr:DeoR/GlpR transcriptional regulator [Actinospica durhamensis]